MERPSLPKDAIMPPSLEATEPAASDTAPLTPAGLSKNADIPPPPKEFDFPKNVGAPSSLNEQKLSRAANNLVPLKTVGLSSDVDFSSLSKPAESPRAANLPLNASRPSNQAQRRLSSKTISSPRTQSIIPPSPRTVESPRTRDKRSMSTGIEFRNNGDLASPLKRQGSSGVPTNLSEVKKRGSLQKAVASLGNSLEPATFPTSSSTPFQEADTTQEQPEPGFSRDLDVSSPFNRPGSTRDPKLSEKEALRSLKDATVELGPTLNPIAFPPDPIIDQPEPATPNVQVEPTGSSAEGQKVHVPKIFIERASEAPDNDMSWYTPRLPTVEEKRQEGKLRKALTGALSKGSGGPKAPSAGLHSPVLPQIAEDEEEPKMPKVKRRKLYLRKARNAAARRVILNLALGRELAHDTKPALRRLAHGEPYGLNSEDHVHVRVSVKTS